MSSRYTAPETPRPKWERVPGEDQMEAAVTDDGYTLAIWKTSGHKSWHYRLRKKGVENALHDGFRSGGRSAARRAAHEYMDIERERDGTRGHGPKGMDVLRAILKRLRWDDQGGYPGLHNGKWTFVSTSLPQTTPEELDELFAFAGIVPDEIVTLGHCKDCAHAIDGRERGYAKPCGECKRPRMSNFIPAKALVRKA